MAQQIQGVYIADGFADDCDELMHRCLREGTLTYEAFCEIWKDMQMSCIFHGRNSGAEIAELSEEVLHIAKRYMVADTSNFEESVAGLFLVYALQNLQPFSRFASLRIVQEDVPAIKRMEMVARRDRRQDVLYILGSVLIKGPVQYQAVLRERGMEYPFRKYLEGYTTIDKLGIRPKGVFYRQNEELDIIRELNNIGMRYNNSKAALSDSGEIDRNLSYVNVNFAKELGASLKNIITGIIDDDEDGGGGGESSSNDSENIDAIKMLKEKAMRSKVKPIKHRVGVCTRSQSSPPSPGIKSPPSKMKKTGPSKTTTSQRNRSKSKKPKKRKRKTNLGYESSEEEDDAKMVTQDSSEDNHEKDNTCETEEPNNTQENESDELDLSNFHKEEEIQETNEPPTSAEQEIDIKIDSLPCVIRSDDDGKSYEIEIIDKLAETADQNVEQNNTTSQEGSNSESSNKEKSDMLKRTDKRDLKKTIVKSRFKRMGMLPVANFQTK